MIQRGAARTKAIVQALHNYSRGEEAAMREVTLARSIDDSLDLLRHPLRQVKVIKEVEPGVRITGFPGQIDQVLINLLTNAAQAMGEKGGTIRVGARERADGVEMFVSDDGPGIPPEVLPRIFDPFFTTKDVGEGSGLGLSIVHGIVDRHGGRSMSTAAPVAAPPSASCSRPRPSRPRGQAARDPEGPAPPAMSSERRSRPALHAPADRDPPGNLTSSAAGLPWDVGFGFQCRSK